MSREQNVPLLLWISAALLAHLATGGGADRLARIFEDSADLHRFAEGIRTHMSPDDGTFEVSFVDDPADFAPPKEPPPEEPPPGPREEPRTEAATPPPEPTPQAPEVEKVEAQLPQTQAQQAPPPPPPSDRRIAVRQHAKPDQEDNPNAEFIADEANHTEEETVAEITSRDQDDPDPTPGKDHAGPSDRPGNSDEHRVADSEDRAGDPERAPGESGKEALEADELPKTAKVDAPAPKPTEPTEPAEKTAAAPPPKAPTDAPKPAPPPPSSGESPAPEVVAQEGPSPYRLDPGRPGRDGPKSPAKLPSTEPPAGSRLGMLGLGATGATPNGINLNLTERGVVAAVGEDTLNRERQADGERRKSAHRGSWRASQFERWRAAIENYVASVKPGNQTALNTARVPFATYLNTIHNRIHPIFADDFLGSLDGLPQNHPLNEPKLATHLEIVLNRDDGRVVKMGVVRTSGVTAFDVAALDSVQRGSPYGKPPSAIVSADGNVYFHWEFHRNPMYACSTMNARPFLLNTPASSEPGPSKTGPGVVPSDPRERGFPDPPAPPSREGSVPNLPHLPDPALAPPTPPHKRG